MLALIDGDRIVMGAGFSSQRVINGELVHLDPPEYAFSRTKRNLMRIVEDCGADDYVVYIANDKKKNFRYDIAKTQPYKANRAKFIRPEHEKAIREYLIANFNCEVVDNIEVDDALGMKQKLEGTIICSNDKDLDMIPGWHYDMDWGLKRKGNGGKYTLKEYKKTNKYYITDPGFLSLRTNSSNKKILVGGGFYWFCAQMLLGDAVDNIPGLPGYGPVKVYDILKDCYNEEDAVKRVWKTYQSALDGLTIDEKRTRLKEVARLCWILRDKKSKIFPGEWLQ